MLICSVNRTTSLGKESKKKAQMELYDNIYEGMNSDIKDDSILQVIYM